MTNGNDKFASVLQKKEKAEQSEKNKMFSEAIVIVTDCLQMLQSYILIDKWWLATILLKNPFLGYGNLSKSYVIRLIICWAQKPLIKWLYLCIVSWWYCGDQYHCPNHAGAGWPCYYFQCVHASIVGQHQTSAVSIFIRTHSTIDRDWVGSIKHSSVLISSF